MTATSGKFVRVDNGIDGANGHGTAFPGPVVVRCCSEEVFLPQVATMCLDWGDQGNGGGQGGWALPGGIVLTGGFPSRFGIQIRRWDVDGYSLRLVWDEVQFGWKRLTRAQVANGCLASLLAAMGTNLDYLLDQPIESEQGADS